MVKPDKQGDKPCITRRGLIRAGLGVAGLGACAALAPLMASTSASAATPVGDRCIDELLGCEPGAVLAELEAHDADGKYLGCPYVGVSDDHLHPSDPDEGMNCTGFVVAVIRAAGGDPNVITRLAKRKDFTSKPDSIENLVYWRWYMANSDVMYYKFASKSALLASGVAKKGDIIICQPNEWDDNWWFGGDGSGTRDNHILFFWGSTPGEDRGWHSSHDTADTLDGGRDITGVSAGKNPGNMISDLTPKCEPSIWFLLPLTEPKGRGFLRKRAARTGWL